jgi:hypothetical protein
MNHPFSHSLHAKPLCPALHWSPPRHHSAVLHSRQYVAPIWSCHCPTGHVVQSQGAVSSCVRKLPEGHKSHAKSGAAA